MSTFNYEQAKHTTKPASDSIEPFRIEVSKFDLDEIKEPVSLGLNKLKYSSYKKRGRDRVPNNNIYTIHGLK